MSDHAQTIDWLDRTAEAAPDDLAVADPGERLTYAELRARAGFLAGTLLRRGVSAGDHVAIDLPAGVAHAVALHGAILAGAVVQSLPPRGRGDAPVAPGAFAVDAETLADADAEPSTWAEVDRDSAAPLTRVLSSGTSGEPKPIELTAANHEASARASAVRLGTDPGDRWLCCLPLNHVGGLTILIRSVIYGTAAVIEDGFDAQRVAALMDSGEVTMASLVPTQLVRLLDSGAPLERPRLLLIGGGPLPLDVLEEALGRGATVVQTYGLTEACSQVCTLAPHEARERSGSAGRPLEGTEVRILDEEILVRGPTVAPGSIAADGWLHTGDHGRLDEEGYLWVEGRRDDLIVSGGENVRPERVEALLREHPGVADAGVVGAEDREWGQVVVAFVVPTPGAEISTQDLLDLARSRLAPPEVPKRVEIAEALPRTATGKLRRAALRGRIS